MRNKISHRNNEIQLENLILYCAISYCNNQNQQPRDVSKEKKDIQTIQLSQMINLTGMDYGK